VEGYNKAQAQALGVAVYDVIQAVKDGLQPGDVPAAMTLLAAFSAASDEIKGDSDAAVLDLISGLSNKLADSRRDDLQLPPAQ
jgi:hypothetical protein